MYLLLLMISPSEVENCGLVLIFTGEMWPEERRDSYCRLGCRQTALPADVYETRCDDDGADGPNDQQNHEEFAVVTTFLAGWEGAADGCAEVLDTNLTGENKVIEMTLKR